MIATIDSAIIHHLIDTIKRKEKQFLFVMRILRIYSLNILSTNHTAVLTIVIVLYFKSFTCLIAGSLYLLTTFLQFSLPHPPFTSGNKFDLFFYEFVCFCFFQITNISEICLSPSDLFHLT